MTDEEPIAKPKFELCQKVEILNHIWKNPGDVSIPGVIGGITIVDGVEYLVVYGDDPFVRPAIAHREWLPERKLVERTQE